MSNNNSPILYTTRIFFRGHAAEYARCVRTERVLATRKFEDRVEVDVPLAVEGGCEIIVSVPGRTG